jgi:hypothetical protein
LQLGQADTLPQGFEARVGLQALPSLVANSLGYLVAHFFAISANIMRRLLVDRARAWLMAELARGALLLRKILHC